jgi:3,4-dihydroxy 2-butanone 4-phosphate synthase/GTP cyclohydrolase II
LSNLAIRAETTLRTEYGEFDMYVFSYGSEAEHVALISGPLENSTLVRIHSECMTGEIFHSMHCECGDQLAHAMKRIGEEGGILIYLRQEGRGLGLTNKIKAYEVSLKLGLDTVQACEHLGLPVDTRDYGAAIAFLRYFEVMDVRLLSGNMKKVNALRNADIKVEMERENLELWRKPGKEESVIGYLRTKRMKMGHV